MPEEIEDYSIEYLNALVKRIILATSLSENEIEKAIGRSYGYISQTRSRGKSNKKLIQVLQATFNYVLQNTGSYNVKNNINGTNADRTMSEIDLLNRIIASLEDQVNGLKEDKKNLREEIERLKKACETSSDDLREYGIVNNAHLKTILEVLSVHRAKTEKVSEESMLEQSDKVLAAKTREILKSSRV